MDNVTLEIVNLDQFITDIATDIEKNMDAYLRQCTGETVTEITRLAESGRNAYNEVLPPYSEGYRKKRKKKGLSEAVNFQFSSSMLRSLVAERRAKLKYTLGVKGGSSGTSNSLKVYYLEQIHNRRYYLLHYTKYLEKQVWIRNAKLFGFEWEG